MKVTVPALQVDLESVIIDWVEASRNQREWRFFVKVQDGCLFREICIKHSMKSPLEALNAAVEWIKENGQSEP